VETRSEDIQRLVTDLSVKNVCLEKEVGEAQVEDSFNAVMHFWNELDKGYKQMITGMRERINGLEEALARYPRSSI